jgi:hypothetical protein
VVRSHIDSGWSAATKVKVVSPEICYSRWARGWFALKPASLQALFGESATACRGRRPQRVIQRIASELGRAVSLACPDKPTTQGRATEIRQSDRLILEA